MITDVHQQIIIECRPEWVLDAFMQTKHTKQWWMGAESFFDLDNKAFSWQWRAEDGRFLYLTIGRIGSYVSGVYLQLEDTWQYDYTAKKPLGPVSLLIECTAQVNDTLLVIKHTGFNTEKAEGLDYARAVEVGWQKVLPQLKNYLERTGK